MAKSMIYTRTGDAGTTALIGGVRVEKFHPRLEAYGTVDELNSHIGLLISEVEDVLPAEVETLRRVQSHLFEVGSALATAGESRPVASAPIRQLEEAIDALDGELPPLKSFILPAGCHAACTAHVARTVCRRAERHVIALAAVEENVVPEVIGFLNRLSDYLFVLARALNSAEGVNETPWVPSATQKADNQ